MQDIRAPLVAVVFFVAACGSAPGVGPAHDCGALPLVFDASGAVVGGADGDACVRLERRADPVEICIACPYTPLRLTASDASHFVDVDDAAQLTYQATHHNWEDAMTATDGDTTAQVRLIYVVDGDAWKLELTFDDGTAQDIAPSGI